MNFKTKQFLAPLIFGFIIVATYQNCAPQHKFHSSEESLNSEIDEMGFESTLETKGSGRVYSEIEMATDGKTPGINAGFTYIGTYQLRNQENGSCLGYVNSKSYYSTLNCGDTSTEYMVYKFTDGTYALCKPGSLRYFEANSESPNSRSRYQAICLGLAFNSSGAIPSYPKDCHLTSSVGKAGSFSKDKDFTMYFNFNNGILNRVGSSNKVFTKRRQTGEVREEDYRNQKNQKWGPIYKRY